MKQIILTLVVVFTTIFTSYCQKVKTNLTVVPLIEQRTYELDGGKILVTGQSRVTLRIELPKNTVEWYYIFSSFSNKEAMESAASTISLASQLTRIIDETGTTAKIASSLFAPSGSGACSVYLFSNYDNAEKFYNKSEQSLFTTENDLWSYNLAGTVESANQGKGIIKDYLNGVCYLGIKSKDSPVNVIIEVAAIVENTEVDLTVWTKESKDLLYNAMMESLSGDFEYDNETSKKISSCCVKKITTEKTIEEFNNMAEFEKDEYLIIVLTNCIETTTGTK